LDHGQHRSERDERTPCPHNCNRCEEGCHADIQPLLCESRFQREERRESQGSDDHREGKRPWPEVEQGIGPLLDLFVLGFRDVLA
jgi:hypothetical protein